MFFCCSGTGKQLWKRKARPREKRAQMRGVDPKFPCIPGQSLGTSPPLTEVSRALRARNAKKVSKMSPGASGPGTPKSLKKVSGTVREVSGESRESVWRVFLEYSGTFWRLFGVPGPEAPGDIFETFSASRARRARETSVRGGLAPKAERDCESLFLSESLSLSVRSVLCAHSLSNKSRARGACTILRTKIYGAMLFSAMMWTHQNTRHSESHSHKGAHFGKISEPFAIGPVQFS